MIRIGRHYLGYILFAVFFLHSLPPARAYTLPCNNSQGGCFTGQQTLTWNGFTRYWEAYVPKGVAANGSAPMLVWLIGATAQDLCGSYTAPPTLPANCGIAQFSLPRFADANKVIVLWPSPTCRDWTVSPTVVCSGSTPISRMLYYWEINDFDATMDPPPDDVGFVHDLIANMAKASWGVGKTTALEGFSTGGFFANRYAVAYPGDIVGFSIFEGQEWAQLKTSTCTGSGVNSGCTWPANPSSPLNVYLAQNAYDVTIKTEGGCYSGWHGANGASTPNAYPSSDTLFNYYQANTCAGGTITTSAGTSSNIVAATISLIAGQTITCVGNCNLNPGGTYVIGQNTAFTQGFEITIASDSGDTATFTEENFGGGTGGYVFVAQKLASQCSRGTQIEYIDRLSTTHVPPTQAETTAAWEFVTGAAGSARGVVRASAAAKIRSSHDAVHD